MPKNIIKLIAALPSFIIVSCSNSPNTENFFNTDKKHEVHEYLKSHTSIQPIKLDSLQYISITKDANTLPNYNKFEEFIILDTINFKNFTLTILNHKDESCCQTIYYITHSPQNTIDNTIVARTGSDGDWDETTFIKSFTKDKTITMRVSTHDIMNPKTHHYDRKTIDKIQTSFVIKETGAINKSVLDSTRSEENIYITN